MRDEPEGNSIMHKSKMRLYSAQSPNKTSNNTSAMSAARRSRRHKLAVDNVNLDNMEDKYLMKKSKKVDISQTCTFNSLNFTTSTTVGQTDTMISHSMVSNTGGHRSKRIDMSWENAVETARGQPDGAEKSFHENKLSRVEEANEEVSVASSGAARSEERSCDDEPQDKEHHPLKKKHTLRGHLKSAAKKLKSLKGKGGKPASSGPVTPTKRRMNNTELPDETCNPESPKKKLKFEEMTRKDRKKMRKLMKNNSELIKSSKTVWEELRRQDLAEERRIELCDVLYKHVKGKVKEMVYAHDTARVIQCLIQFGDPDQRQMVFEEIKDQVVPMAKSRYGKYVLRKIFKYGTRTQKNFVFKAFHGNVRKLIRHREAADLVEYAYNEFANAGQRLALLEEFYGPSFTLFKLLRISQMKNNTVKVYPAKVSVEKNHEKALMAFSCHNHDMSTFETKCLDDIMMNQPDKREMILSNMKEALFPLIDKSIVVHSLVHRVFSEFFQYANAKMKSDMVEVLREHVVSMAHTRDGARVAMQCVWHGTAKDRKIIVKSLKPHIVKVCKEEYGHMVLLALFDVVDDTKILQKVIIEEVLRHVGELAEDQYGRKVLIYLLSPRDPLHFHPDIVRILQEGDSNTTSKKDASTRHKELLESVSQPLLQYVIDHAKNLVLNNASLLFLLSIITHAQGDPTEAMEAVAKIAAEPFTAGSLDNFHIVEHPAGHLTLKRLILNDKDRAQQGSTVLFSRVLMKTLPPGRLKSWAACNRGCFILLGLLELENPEVTKAVKDQLAGVKKSLKKMTFKGSHILLQKLDAVE